MKARRMFGAAVVPALLLASLVSGTAAAHGGHDGHRPKVKVVASGLDNPRGITIGASGEVLVAEAGTGSILKLVRGGTRAVATGLPTATSPEGETTGPVNVAADRWGPTYALVGAGPQDVDPAFATVQKLGRNAKALADIAAYQATDPDPDDQDGNPAESNPYGIAALGNGRLLVADAANNDLLLVGPKGIKTVARIPRHLVSTSHVGDPNLPPELPAEAVPTSVAIGPDGYWYVAELTGFRSPRARPGSGGSPRGLATPRATRTRATAARCSRRASRR